MGLLLVLSTVPASAASGAEFGAYPGPRGNQDKFQALDALERDLGRQLDVVRVFKKWDDELGRFDHETAREGRKLLLSVTSTRRNNSYVKWNKIANAQPGSAEFKNMVRWAKQIRDLNRPVVLVFNHEPESTYNKVKGTASEYRDAYGRWVQVMRQYAGDKVEFATSSTSWGFRVDRDDYRHISKWLPNKMYWDHMGVQVYNFWTCRPGVQRWIDADVFTDAIHAVASKYPDKGVWFTEVGAVERNGQASAKADWVRTLDREVRSSKWRQFQGMTWYHTDELSDENYDRNCDWWIDSSNRSEQTFRELGRSGYWS